MKKKTLSAVILVSLFVNPFSFTFAKTKLIYDRSEDLAVQYIENSLNDDNWKDNNPRISGKGKYFYTDDENKPSYIEFKISCDKTPDCGFILVNADGDDVAIPISSTSGNTPSEVTHQQGVNNEKYYYFGPLDIYSENLDNGDVQTIVKTEQIDLKKNDKETNDRKKELKNRIKKGKLEAKEFKKSDEFKKKKEEIKDEILNVPSEEYSMKILNFANADLPGGTNGTYTSPGTSDIKVPGSNTTDCTSRTPCYQQFQTTYGSLSCSSGCAPTAVAILFGYYDRNGLSNLVSGTAPTTEIMNTTSKGLVTSVAGKIGTYCKGTEGATNITNIPNAKQYAIDKGYLNTTSSFISGTTATLFTEIKSEINLGRPVISNIIYQKDGTQRGHTTVVYGYKSSPSNSNIVLMNMGWGVYKVDGLNTYTYSSINQNLSSVYYFGSYNKPVTSIVKFNIKN
ncbi:MAG: C39 family peptidase [Candidatus Gracilibacteria bacterium]|nr:C39 family peptidase [Candidatus Gracilibacteria bacterium]